MRKNKENKEQNSNLKKKLSSALAMLLVATTLMTTTSYAWFVLSTAPEVGGIATNIGANGSLEIALLNSETRQDPSKIRSGVPGDTLAAGNLAANESWGNLVDLGYTAYGLGDVLLMPARLNAISGQNGITVNTGMLTAPTYGYDGRILDVSDSNITATYQNNEFSFVNGQQDYGVRAVGTSDAMTSQESGLANAKSSVATLAKSANTNAQGILREYGEGLFEIVLAHVEDEYATYDIDEKTLLLGMLGKLQGSLDDIDMALRHGLVAYAASELADEDEYELAVKEIMTRDEDHELTDLIDSLGASTVDAAISGFSGWVTKLAVMQNNLNEASNKLNQLDGSTYTWDQIKEILNYVMNVEMLYIDGSTMDDLDIDALIEKASNGGLIEATLATGSGIFADIADFADDYSASFKYLIVDIELSTLSTVGTKYLTDLSGQISSFTAAGGTGASAPVLPLTSTYGYALDLAFRCNAPGADLLLQTTPQQRVYSGDENGENASTSASTQGSGSYMEFSSLDPTLTLDQKDALMDAIRVGFLDKAGNLLGIAKLNTSNRTVDEGGVIKSDLYLYDYAFEMEGETLGALVMGERLTRENKLMDLQQGAAEFLTVLVWLDGDLVDNSMVSATAETSLNGVLNLQFSTSADLNPAMNSRLFNYSADITGLSAAMDSVKETYEAGQANYTTVSWTPFATACADAQRMLSAEDPTTVSAVEIQRVINKLAATYPALEQVSQEAIQNKVTTLRNTYGTATGETARYVIQDENGNYMVVGHEDYTQEQYDSWNHVGTLDALDYNGNILGGENGEVATTIYTDASWNAMAAALYQAEAVTMNPNSSEAEINAAITALEQAEETLERQVFFKPYDYNGVLYYEAICDADKADTYGKWYDSNFNRVTSDLTIMKLDAYAQEAVITDMGGDVYIAADQKDEKINTNIDILDDVYTSLGAETVKGVSWSGLDNEMFTESMNSSHRATLNRLIGIVNDNGLTDVDITKAQELLNPTDPNKTVTAAEAEAEIASLNEAVTKALEKKAEDDAANNTSMTADYRTLLTAAVNSAKSAEGYDDATNTEAEMVTLRTATEAAETLLAAADPQQTDAETKLSELNAALKALKMTEVTASNTLTTKLPQGAGSSGIVYETDYPDVGMTVNGTAGSSTVTAQVLTQNGVVATVSKNVVVYDRADGTYMQQGDTKQYDKPDTIITPVFKVEESKDFTAGLYYAYDRDPSETAPTVRENVVSYTWSSNNTEVLSVSGMNAAKCTATGLKEGDAVLSVSMTTREGNTYTARWAVKVEK